jgi:hypothetical protein
LSHYIFAMSGAMTRFVFQTLLRGDYQDNVKFVFQQIKYLAVLTFIQMVFRTKYIFRQHINHHMGSGQVLFDKELFVQSLVDKLYTKFA